MASYPGSKVSYTNPSGTTLVDTGVDHAGDHASLENEVVAIETAMGTTAGTNIHKNFAAGHFPLRINASSVMQDTVAAGTINAGVLGTPAITGGTVQQALLGTSTVKGGTVANASIGTPTMIGGTIAVSGTVTPLSIGAAIAPTVVTLTDAAGGTVTANAQAAQVFHLIMGTSAGNRTIGTPTNAATDGQVISYRIKQNANNTGTLIWADIFRMSDAGTPVAGTANTYNYYSYRYNAIDTKWDYQGASRNIV